MPLYEIETDGHIIITWAVDQEAAQVVAENSYPMETIKRMV